MKIPNKILCATIAFSILTLSSFANAGGHSGPRIIKQLLVRTNGAVQAVGDTPWNNPDDCEGATTAGDIVLRPPVDGTGATQEPYYSEMYALLVASFLQGKPVSAYLQGCYTLDNVDKPVLRTVNVVQ